MKTIGSTRDGMLVSMTNEEHDEFCRLERIVNKQWPKLDRDYPLGLHDDLGPVFAAVRAFSEAKFRVNELQDQVNLLRHVLEGELQVEQEVIQETSPT